MKNIISKTLTAATLTAALLASVSATAFAAEDSATSDETVNPGNYEYSITDATNVQKAVAKISTLTEEQEFLYDIDGSDGITISDATTVQKIVAKIKDQPTYHTEAGTVEVEHPAEYETVTKQVWVEGEETTVEKAIYAQATREICNDCGKDITPLFNRYDTAVANGDVDPDNENLTVIDDHYYYFYTENGDDYDPSCIGKLLLAAGETGYDANGNWVTAKIDIYSVPSDDFFQHLHEDGSISWSWHSYSTGWYYCSDMPDDIEKGIDTLHWLHGHDLTEVTNESELEAINTCGINDSNLRLEEVKWTDSAGNTLRYTLIYKTVTTTTEGHYEDVTEEVLVKEAYTETVTVPGGRWYCD